MTDDNMEIIKLQKFDGTWENFRKDWIAQCEAFGEDFDNYAEGTFSVVTGLVDSASTDAGLFAIKLGDSHACMLQLNKANLPGYTGPVLRVRFLTLSPDYDFGNKSVEDYSDVLVTAFALVLAVSNDAMKADHIKLHLPSPADRQFFAILGKGLETAAMFRSVHVQGSWLYVTK